MSFDEKAKEYQVLINRGLSDFFGQEEKGFLGHVHSFVKSYTLAGGKRIRPIATFLAYEALTRPSKDILMPALAIELDHTHSLILDDMMDEDDYRRGKPSVHKMARDYFISKEEYNGTLFSRKDNRLAASFAAMLANTTWISSRRLILESNFPEKLRLAALSLMEKTDMSIYHGQMLDMAMETRDMVSEEEYLEMTALKTGYLFGLAFATGALFAGADNTVIEKFTRFGIDSAVAFQIQDDILDTTGSKGHEIGSDIRRGKKTILWIKTLELADDRQKRLFQGIYGRRDASSEEVKQAISMMHECKAFDHCLRLASLRKEKAKSHLDFRNKEIFHEFADYLIERRK